MRPPAATIRSCASSLKWLAPLRPLPKMTNQKKTDYICISKESEGPAPDTLDETLPGKIQGNVGFLLLVLMESSIIDKFFSFLRFSIGTAASVPVMSYQELKVIHALSRKQALLGVMLGGLQRMGEAAVTVRPEENDAYGQLIMKWVGEGAVIARQNKKVDADVAGLFTDLNEIGFECCLLKGQGNARLYPRPEERTSGDIDVWVRPKREKREGSAKEQKRDIMEVISLAKDADPSARAIYHHVEYLPHEGTEVELHYRPQFMSGFRHNAKLQRYFREHADAQFSHKLLMEGHMIAVPTWEFNVVSQTSHIFKHLFHEGIGLRQLMDYFYLLTSVGEARKSEYLCKAVLKRLGLKEIAGALCWILVEKFGMEERYSVFTTPFGE